jgi:hypothetical protein
VATVASEAVTLRPIGHMGKSIILHDVNAMSQNDKHLSVVSMEYVSLISTSAGGRGVDRYF